MRTEILSFGVCVLLLSVAPLSCALARASQAQPKQQQSKRSDQASVERFERLHYVHQVQRAHEAWQAKDYAGAQLLLDNCRPDLRGWEHDYVYSRMNDGFDELSGHSNRVWDLEFTADGKQLVSGADSTVCLWDVDASRRTRILRGHTEGVLRIALSPDGKWIASTSYDRTIKIWDVAKGSVHQSWAADKALTSLAFSRDGTRIATAARDADEVTFWDWKTGQKTASLKGHARGVSCILFAPNGRELVSGGSVDKTIRIWDVETGSLIKELSDTGKVKELAYSPDGSQLACCHSDQSLSLWDLESGQLSWSTEKDHGVIFSVAFSPNGKTIATGGDHTIELWDAQTGDILRELNGHQSEGLSLCFHPSGNLLASGSGDHSIKLWNLAAPELPLTVEVANDTYSRLLAGNVDGAEVVCVAEGGLMKLLDLQSGDTVSNFEQRPALMSSLAASKNGSAVVSLDTTGELRLWDTTTLQYRSLGRTSDYSRFAAAAAAVSPDAGKVAVFTGNKIVMYNTGHPNEQPKSFQLDQGARIGSMDFSGDGKKLVCGGSGGEINSPDYICIVDAETGQVLNHFNDHTGRVCCVTFSHDSCRFASASSDKTVRVWNAETGQLLETLVGHSGKVNSVAFSPDGRRLVSGSYDRTVKIWDTESGFEILTLRGHDGTVNSATFSRDGRHVVSWSSDGTVKSWSASRSSSTSFITGSRGSVDCVAVNHDGTVIAGAGSYTEPDPVTGRLPVKGEIRTWDAATGGELLTLTGFPGSITALCFDPSGTRILGSLFSGIHYWDAKTGEKLKTILRHSGSISSVALSPRNNHIAAAGHPIRTGNAKTKETERTKSAEIKIWNIDSGDELHVLSGHVDSVRCVAYCNDGARLVSGADDKTVRIWDAKNGKELYTLVGHDAPVLGVASRPGTTQFASSGGTQIILWDVMTGEQVTSLGGRGDLFGHLAFSPNGRYLVSSANGDSVILWDVERSRQIEELQIPNGMVRSVVFAPNGQRVIIGAGQRARPGSVVVWDVEDRLVDQSKESSILPESANPAGMESGSKPTSSDAVEAPAEAVETDADRSTQVEAGSAREAGRNINALTTAPETISSLTLEPTGLESQLATVSSLAFAQDGGLMAACGSFLSDPQQQKVEGAIEIWKLDDSGENTRPLLVQTLRLGDRVNAVAMRFSEDGKTLTAAFGHIVTWDVQTGKRVKQFPISDPWPAAQSFGRGPMHGLVYSPDGKRLGIGGTCLWDIEKGAVAVKLKSESRGAIAFSPNGQLVATAEHHNRVHLWDAADGRQLAEDHAMMGPLYAVAISPDGEHLVAGGVGGAKLWDIRQMDKGVELQKGPARLHVPPVVEGVAFSPDGRLLAVRGVGSIVKLFDVETQNEVASPDWSASVMAFSSDGTKLAVGGRRRMEDIPLVRIWDVPQVVSVDGVAARSRAAVRDFRLGLKQKDFHREVAYRSLWALGPQSKAIAPLLADTLNDASLGGEAKGQVILALGGVIRYYGTADVSLLSKHLVPILEEASKDAELQQQAAYLMRQIDARRNSDF